jgi:hypothetical protein
MSGLSPARLTDAPSTGADSSGLSPSTRTSYTGAERFGDHPISHIVFFDLMPKPDVFGAGTWEWITDFVTPDDTDIDLALF